MPAVPSRPPGCEVGGPQESRDLGGLKLWQPWLWACRGAGGPAWVSDLRAATSPQREARLAAPCCCVSWGPASSVPPSPREAAAVSLRLWSLCAQHRASRRPPAERWTGAGQGPGPGLGGWGVGPALALPSGEARQTPPSSHPSCGCVNRGPGSPARRDSARPSGPVSCLSPHLPLPSKDHSPS